MASTSTLALTLDLVRDELLVAVEHTAAPATVSPDLARAVGRALELIELLLGQGCQDGLAPRA